MTDARIAHLAGDLERIASGNGAGATAPLATFPVDALPSPIADWVRAAATATQTPVDLPAGMALAALSTAALGAATIRCAPDWEEELAAWLVCVLPSGERKSAVLRAAVEPIRELERERLESARPAIVRKRAERDALQARRKALMRKIGEGKATPDDLGDVAEQLEQLGEPVLPRMLTDDATPEALAGLLALHGSIGILAAESALLDNLAGRYAEGRANLHLTCQAYSGEPTSIDRRGRDPEQLERPLLSLGLCVQPHVLRRLTADETMREQGFLARVAFLLPESNVGARDIDPPPVDAEITSRYRECVRRVAGLRLADTTDQTGREGDSVGSVSVSQDPTLTFSSDAAEAFRDWRAAHEARLAQAIGDLAPVAAWANRHPGRVARIAGLLHLVEHRREQPIRAETFHAAARVGEYFVEHALAALTEDPVRAAAERAREWLLERPQSVVTVRDLHRGPVGGGRGSVARARQVVNLLERESFLRRRSDPVPDPAGGRPPSPSYDVLVTCRHAEPIEREGAE